MENMGGVTTMMMLSFWGNYVLWDLIYAAMIIACVVGWKKIKNVGFIFILCSTCLNLFNHLPSIFINTRMLIQPESLLPTKYLYYFTAVKGAIGLLAALLLTAGFFLLSRKNAV
jgi:hypothetical protein